MLGLNGIWVEQDILDKTKVEPGRVSAFVELHIEQGPLLEREGLQIGVVTAIAAPASFRVQFNGDGGHAGALLMHDRSADTYHNATLPSPSAIRCTMFCHLLSPSCDVQEWSRKYTGFFRRSTYMSLQDLPAYT